MKPLLRLLSLVVGCLLLPPVPPCHGQSPRGSWDLSLTRTTPEHRWGAVTGQVQEVWYTGESLRGRPTRVFAYLGRPSHPRAGRTPAMLLVHGGGGKAFREWADHWAQRGYVALAMDLSGNGPSGRLPDGGPDQSDAVKFREFSEAEVTDMWTHHAVGAVLRGHGLLRSLPEVDADRIGVTGISWGGYLTCIVAGVDPGLRVAVPVYGCGFLGDNSFWKDKSLAALTPESRERWLRHFDPGQYLGGVRCPILFLNGTTDFAYPLDSYQKSYREVPTKWRHTAVIINLPHGHIWTFPEVDAFVDASLRFGKPLVGWGRPRVEGEVLRATVDRARALREAILCYTTDAGPWQARKWLTTPATIAGRRVTAALPPERPLVAYLQVTDERGLRTSGEHVELPAAGR